ncbi:MAG TPA: hypothetical protein VFM94_07120 [Solirubrobacterales bacterium]|nr:hypothetical protein [Solirubrobacterales bacterium]
MLRRDRFLCVECGSVAAEVDHVLPREIGGRDELRNLRSSALVATPSDTGAGVAERQQAAEITAAAKPTTTRRSTSV